jgi:1-acyl-sn-glycerol-3-phosphate acyltransferase
VLFVLVTALFAPLALLATAADLVAWLRRRKPWMALRLLALLWWFLLGEVWGLSGLLRVWVISLGRDPAPYRRRVYRLRQRWLAHHLAGVRVLFRLRFELDGLEQAGPGPVLILIRHTSILDNLLPDTIIGRAHDLGLRYVLKRELLALPTIDIGRGWAPTVFVRRGSGETAVELARVRELPVDLAGDEGVLIYPEGTRFTAQKLARAKEIVAERQPALGPLAARLRHVLPPRLGGTVALLQAARGADVVVCGHVGLDGFEYVSDIWRGAPVRARVRIKFWRIPACEIPLDDEDAAVTWLYERWFELDEWIDQQLSRDQLPVGRKALG